MWLRVWVRVYELEICIQFSMLGRWTHDKRVFGQLIVRLPDCFLLVSVCILWRAKSQPTCSVKFIHLWSLRIYCSACRFMKVGYKQITVVRPKGVPFNATVLVVTCGETRLVDCWATSAYSVNFTEIFCGLYLQSSVSLRRSQSIVYITFSIHFSVYVVLR